ncbi:MAG: 50S ribosomal protein L35 [Chloroflexi bacterium]|nr:50S ribosomal protein L35 [Chloroflexota bacterium]
MPKLKTRSSIKRRFRVTGTGKIMRRKMGRSHLRRHKSKRTKREYSKNLEVHPADEKRLRIAIHGDLR